MDHYRGSKRFQHIPNLEAINSQLLATERSLRYRSRCLGFLSDLDDRCTDAARSFIIRRPLLMRDVWFALKEKSKSEEEFVVLVRSMFCVKHDSEQFTKNYPKHFRELWSQANAKTKSVFLYAIQDWHLHNIYEWCEETHLTADDTVKDVKKDSEASIEDTKDKIASCGPDTKPDDHQRVLFRKSERKLSLSLQAIRQSLDTENPSTEDPFLAFTKAVKAFEWYELDKDDKPPSDTAPSSENGYFTDTLKPNYTIWEALSRNISHGKPSELDPESSQYGSSIPTGANNPQTPRSSLSQQKNQREYDTLSPRPERQPRALPSPYTDEKVYKSAHEYIQKNGSDMSKQDDSSLGKSGTQQRSTCTDSSYRDAASDSPSSRVSKTAVRWGHLPGATQNLPIRGLSGTLASVNDRSDARQLSNTVRLDGQSDISSLEAVTSGPQSHIRTGTSLNPSSPPMPQTSNADQSPRSPSPPTAPSTVHASQKQSPEPRKALTAKSHMYSLGARSIDYDPSTKNTVEGEIPSLIAMPPANPKESKQAQPTSPKGIKQAKSTPSKAERMPRTPRAIAQSIHNILRQPIDDGNKGYVYVLKAPLFFEKFPPAVERGGKQWVKIGISRNVGNRVRSLSAQCGFEDLEECKGLSQEPRPMDRLRRIERVCHEELANFKCPLDCKLKTLRSKCETVHDEWFCVPEEVAVRTVNRWLSFLDQHPYSKAGILTDEWGTHVTDGEYLQTSNEDYKDYDAAHNRFQSWLSACVKKNERTSGG